MIFAHEYKVKPETKGKKRRNTYPIAPSTPEKSQFYNKELSQSFGNRFSYEPFVRKNNDEIDKKDIQVLIKKK